MIRSRIDDDQEDGRYYEARLYPSHRNMLAAVRRAHAWVGEGGAGRNTGAATLHQHTERLDGKRWVADKRAGFIMLDAEFVNADVVSHEAAHAAMGLYRLRHGGTLRGLGRNLSDKEAACEEELARSVGRMADELAFMVWHPSGRRRKR